MAVDEEVQVNSQSCVGCKYLYLKEDGYSNYTVTDVDVLCALERNPELPAPLPDDWRKEPDNWPRTNVSRCSQYGKGPEVRLDVDRMDGPADFTDDEEQIAAICAHASIERHGRTDGT
jgi:hypothetical protein